MRRRASNFYTLHLLRVATGTVAASFSINGAHAIFAGHFPGHPVLPGVCELQLVKEVLEQVAGRPLLLAEAAQVKFLQFISPQAGKAWQLDIAYRCEAARWVVDARIKDGATDCFKLKGIFNTLT